MSEDMKKAAVRLRTEAALVSVLEEQGCPLHYRRAAAALLMQRNKFEFDDNAASTPFYSTIVQTPTGPAYGGSVVLEWLATPEGSHFRRQPPAEPEGHFSKQLLGLSDKSARSTH